MPIKGRAYTWSNMQQQPLLEQLDWFFTMLNLTTSLPNTMVNPLGKPVSDHTACSMIIQITIPKSKLFRFESYWIAHPGFMEVVEQAWKKPIKYNRQSNSATRIGQKLKAVRYALKQWSKKISRLNVAI